MRQSVFVAAVIATAALVTACASPGPTPTGTLVASPVPFRETPRHSSAKPSTVITVGDWSATCEGVPSEDCEGVAGLFINNLARNWHWVFEASGGALTVEPRLDCPVLPTWAVPDACWQAFAPIETGRICMIVARQSDAHAENRFGFGQAGGDEMAGSASGPSAGWPTCD